MMTEMDMQQSLWSSLAKRQKEQTQNRASDLLRQLFGILEPVASAVEGSDLGTIEDPCGAYSKVHQ